METREDDERMLHAAHASAYHWSEAPECEPKNVPAASGRSRGSTRCSAARSRRCTTRGVSRACEANADNMEEWDLPFAYEALARAHRVAGMNEEAAGYKQKAQELGDQIRDEEDREHLHEALASIS